MIDATIRLAAPDEADCLSDLALRSKAHWGYTLEFLESCRQELAVEESLIRARRVFVLEVDGSIGGFFSLEDHPSGQVELGHLFVEPGRIGSGIGRMLVQRACKEAGALGFSRLIVQGDPNAEDFYLRCGATRMGDLESLSIAGRMLPLFEFDLASGPSSPESA